MRLRRLFVSLFLALGQFYGWLAIISRWLANRLEQTAESTALPEPAPTASPEPEPALGQPPAHWLAHVRREPPIDWLEKVRQGAPQLLDPQMRPSRPPAPPPARSPTIVRPAGHRPPSAAERTRARPLKQVAFRSAGPAATQTDKQSPLVTPALTASLSAKTAFAGSPGSPPDTAEAAEDGPPLPEGRLFLQAAFPDSDNQSGPTPATTAPPLRISSSDPADSLGVAVPASAPSTPPATAEIKRPAETAALPLKPSHRRMLFAADFPRQTPPGNKPDTLRLEEKVASPAPPARRVLKSRPAPPVPAPIRPSTRPLEEIRQQPVNRPITSALEESSAVTNDDAPVRPPEETFTTGSSPIFSSPTMPDTGSAVRADYWPPLPETTPQSHAAVPKELPIPAPAAYLPAQRPSTAARNVSSEEWPVAAAQPITADQWPALPNTFLDETAGWEEDFYAEEPERRLRLDFEQRGPEWNE